MGQMWNYIGSIYKEISVTRIDLKQEHGMVSRPYFFNETGVSSLKDFLFNGRLHKAT